MSFNLPSLADPAIRHVDAIIVDYLVMEAVQTLRASTVIAMAKRRQREKDLVDAGLVLPDEQAPAVPKKDVNRESMASIASKTTTMTTTTTKVEEGPDEEEVYSRLEAIGVHIGSNVAERCVLSYPT